MVVEPGKMRLLYLLRMMHEETDADHGLSMPQIIERLAAEGIPAERKAIYRDIDVLREFGIEIKKHHRKTVEYALAQRTFSLPELLLLVDAVQNSRFLTQSKSDALVKTLKKMASKHEAKSLSKRVHVEGRIKTQNESVYLNVDCIHQAMREKRKISFWYFKHDLKKSRKMQRDGKRYIETPVHLVYADGNYYLVTYNDKYADFTTYRVDRMLEIELCEEPATRNSQIANFNAEEFQKCAFGMFRGDMTPMTLLVDESAMSSVIDRFGKDVRLGTPEGNRARVHVSVMESPILFGWLSQFGNAVAIEKPKHLADAYAEHLRSILDMYE
ncbi:MAG: WYL domain-containing protein [Eggerthellaceae bacterium]|nr:WYL domain-containing protein [Eggerthellaceae bacterium]